MKNKKRIVALVALILALAATGWARVPAKETSADQPLMREARNQLQVALAELQKATNNQGGHRDNAIKLTQNAIDEVNQGIAYGRRHAHGILFSAADQPYLESALERLRKAKTKLESAVGDKGGHRDNALKLVNDAIDEITQGIAAAS